MRWLVLVVLLAALAACGGDDGGTERRAGSDRPGLTLDVAFDEPLRSGQPVIWRLEVRNRRPDPVTLVFRSGQDGDVALVRDGREVYRWSATRYFTQAVRQVPLGPGEEATFTLEEKSLPVEPGDYELVAELAAEPAPPPVRRPVTVREG